MDCLLYRITNNYRQKVKMACLLQCYHIDLPYIDLCDIDLPNQRPIGS